MVFMREFGLSKHVVVLAVAVAVAGRGSVGIAEDVEAIFKKGTELRRQGRDAEALAEFQRAARVQASPRATAQIALAEQALGMWLDANTHLTQALERGNDAWIQKNRGALDQALDTIRAHLCEFDAWGAPAGAEVLIDGKRAGTLPKMSTWLAPGDVPFQVRASGYADVNRTLKVPEGGRLREHINLRPLAATGARAVTPAPMLAPEDPGPGMAVPAGVAPPATESEGRPMYTRWWFWTLVGVGVVAAGGTAVWLVTQGDNNAGSCVGPCSTW